MLPPSSDVTRYTQPRALLRMNTPVANNLLQHCCCPSCSSCWTCNLSYSIPFLPHHPPSTPENFPFDCSLSPASYVNKPKREREGESAWKVQQNQWRCGRAVAAASCEWHFKRLVRNRGCFKRTPDEDVVKRHAAAATTSTSVAPWLFLLRISFVASWVSSSSSDGATVVNILRALYPSLSYPCATCILYLRNTCCARIILGNRVNLGSALQRQTTRWVSECSDWLTGWLCLDIEINLWGFFIKFCRGYYFALTLFDITYNMVRVS